MKFIWENPSASKSRKSVNIKNKLAKQLSTTDTPHFYFDDFFLDQHGCSIFSLFLVKVPPHQISRAKRLPRPPVFLISWLRAFVIFASRRYICRREIDRSQWNTRRVNRVIIDPRLCCSKRLNRCTVARTNHDREQLFFFFFFFLS